MTGWNCRFADVVGAKGLEQKFRNSKCSFKFEDWKFRLGRQGNRYLANLSGNLPFRPRNLQMKRSITVGILTVFVGLSTASTSQACLYIPWLDPFAWLGFYGCGGGYGCGAYGGGCGYAAPSYGYGYQQQQAYVPQVPVYSAPQILNYPIAPATPDCNCTSAAPQPQMAAVRVPVTTYRAVTQYVPQTTYRTQYRPIQPAYAVTQPVYGSGLAYGGYPATAYGSYVSPYSTAYNTAGLQMPTSNTAPLSVPGGYPIAPGVTSPAYSQPAFQGGVATPVPAGDINGDHEYPTQSAVAPLRSPYPPQRPQIRPVSYARPTAARAYPSAVR